MINGKTYGEGNVHVARWKAQAAKMSNDDLVGLYGRLPKARLTNRLVGALRELERRGLQDLGVEAPKAWTERHG